MDHSHTTLAEREPPDVEDSDDDVNIQAELKKTEEKLTEPKEQVKIKLEKASCLEASTTTKVEREKELNTKAVAPQQVHPRHDQHQADPILQG